MVPKVVRCARALYLATVVAGALVSPARAQNQDAESIILEGVELRRQRDDEGALKLFRRAYDIAPTPRAAAQMALAEQALQRWVDADRHLAEALRATIDPWIRKNRAVLEQSRRTVGAKIGHLAVGGEPAAGEVSIDGERVGTLPIPEAVAVAPGPVRKGTFSAHWQRARLQGRRCSTRSATPASGAATPGRF